MAQREVAAQSHEITAVQPRLAHVDLPGKVVTADAMPTQVELARSLVEDQGADYWFTVKGNQPTRLSDLPLLGEEDFSSPYPTYDQGHGRIQHRSIRVSSVLQGYLEFPYAAQVGRIDRVTTDLRGAKPRRDTAYAVTSLSPEAASPQRRLELARGHGYIENRRHWVGDVTGDEDRCQVRTGSGPRALATLRNLTISLLRLHRFTNIAASLRTHAQDAARALALAGI